MVLGELTGRDVPYAYNRKEAKDHGEGGTLVGASLKVRGQQTHAHTHTHTWRKRERDTRHPDT
jgi:hypothetical protein